MAEKQKFITFLLIGLGFTIQGTSRFSQLIVYSDMSGLDLIYSSFTLIFGVSVLSISRNSLKKMRKIQ